MYFETRIRFFIVGIGIPLTDAKKILLNVSIILIFTLLINFTNRLLKDSTRPLPKAKREYMSVSVIPTLTIRRNPKKTSFFSSLIIFNIKMSSSMFFIWIWSNFLIYSFMSFFTTKIGYNLKYYEMSFIIL